MSNAIIAIIQTTIVGVFMFYFSRRETKRYQMAEKRAEIRKQEGRLSLKMLMANGKLSYACAMAIRRGKPNGEMEDALKDYDGAKKEYYDFINNEYVEHIQE